MEEMMVQTTMRLEHGTVVDWGIDDGNTAAILYEGIIDNWIKAGLTVERSETEHAAWVTNPGDQRRIQMTVVPKDKGEK